MTDRFTTDQPSGVYEMGSSTQYPMMKQSTRQGSKQSSADQQRGKPGQQQQVPKPMFNIMNQAGSNRVKMLGQQQQQQTQMTQKIQITSNVVGSDPITVMQSTNQKKGRKIRKNKDLLAQAVKQNLIVTAPAGGATSKSTEKRKNQNSRNVTGGYFLEAGGSLGGPAPQHHLLSHQDVISGPSMFSQVSVINKNMVPLSAHNETTSHGNNALYTYGALSNQLMTSNKDRKGSQIPNSAAGCYEAFTAQRQPGTGYSQSQRAGSQVSSRNNNQSMLYPGSLQTNSNHNTSLFSHISLKDQQASPPKVQPKKSVKLLDQQQTRNPSLHLNGTQGQTGLLFYNSGNMPSYTYQTQQLDGSKGQAKRYIQVPVNHTQRKSNENLIIHPQQLISEETSVGQPILNINTASDINIYNNSFIVNTTGAVGSNSNLFSKKLSGSNIQSRSNSQKRNVAGGAGPGSALAGNSSQSKIGVATGINSVRKQSQVSGNGSSGQINLQNILGITNDYQTRTKSQQRTNSSQRLSNAGGSSQEQLQKFNQIAEAYTASNFFRGGGAGSHGSVLTAAQNQILQNLISHHGGVMPSHPQSQVRQVGDKKMIKLTNRKNKTSSNSQNHQGGSLFNPNLSMNHQQQRNQVSHQQQSYTQSFDNMLPLNSSSEHLLSASSTTLAKTKASQGSKKQGLKFTGSLSKVKYSQSQNRLQGRDSEQEFIGMMGIANQSTSNEELGGVIFNSTPNLVNRSQVNKSGIQSQNLLIQAKKRIQEQDYKGAINLLTEAIKLDPINNDAKFYRALSQLDSGQNLEAIEELKQIIQCSSVTHAQLSHILLSIAYKRLNDHTSALKILSDCIEVYPTYPDAHLARGQALLYQEKYADALKDFTQYTLLMPTNGMGFVGVGDTQKALKHWQPAITAYSKALQLFTQGSQNTDQTTQDLQIVQATLKRGLAYFHLKMYQQAIVDLQHVVRNDVSQIKAHFYIGKILSRQYLNDSHLDHKMVDQKVAKQLQKIQNEAILHFEQVVKHHNTNGEVYAGNALFEIAKLRLNDKDFYEAYFNLKRAVDSNFNSKRLQLYKDFTEGVLYLIKRKIKKGVQILSDLLEVLVNTKDKKDKAQLDYLKHQSYMYRAYGYVAIEKYEIALQDIKRAKKISKLDAASVYNKLLGKGILRMDHEDYIMATKYFTKAATKFQSNKDPYCLYIISIVRSYSYSHSGQAIDQETKMEQVRKAKVFLDNAIEKCNLKVKVPSLYFFRGLLNFQMHQFYLALKDFSVAIEEEEEPTAAYYLARGRTYACLSILSEAMKDLSIAINLDETLQDAYIYRGKCAYLLGDNNLAFMDFQRLILTDPKNPMVHVYAGNLLMTTGAYQDAIKAFLNADTVQKTAVAAFQRARCFCALTDLENAKMQFKMALQLCQNKEDFVTLDSQVLSTLMRVMIASQQTSSFQTETTIKGAIDTLNQCIGYFEEDKIRQFNKRDCQLNIQIIPNVKRIKLEKVAVARDMMVENQKDPHNRISFSDFNEDLQGSVDADLAQLDEIIPYSYYYENVFSLEDLYLFRAVYKFYMKDYLGALKDYVKCHSIKQEESMGIKKTPGKQQQPTPQESMQVYSRTSTPLLSMNSSKTDLSDVGLCSLNLHENNYNMMLCYIQMNDHSSALKKASEIIQGAPGKYQRHFFLIRGLLYEVLGEKEKAVKDLQKYEKSEPKIYSSYFKDGKDLIFEPFPIKSRLCSRFDFIRYQPAPGRPNLLLKPSFSMPFIKPPNMIPNIDEENIQGEFTLKQIDAPMPEAPWIRRWTNNKHPEDSGCGIKFTDNILREDEDGEIEDQLDDDDGQGGVDISEIRDEFQFESHKECNKDLFIHKQTKPNKSKKEPVMIQEDTSPYLQSLEVPHQPQQQLTKQNLSEHILKQQLPNAMMIYQFVGDVMDLDQISDKHKISLFDDSRYDEGGTTLDAKKTSLSQPFDEYTHSSNKKSLSKPGRILRKDRGGDSLYDEQLLEKHLQEEEEKGSVKKAHRHTEDEVGFEFDENNMDSDDDEDTSSEEEKAAAGYTQTQQSRIGKNAQGNQSFPPLIDDSTTVLLGDTKKPKAPKKRKPQPLQLLEGDQTPQHKRHLSQLDLEQEEEGAGDSSIFRSRQSSKR